MLRITIWDGQWQELWIDVLWIDLQRRLIWRCKKGREMLSLSNSYKTSKIIKVVGCERLPLSSRLRLSLQRRLLLEVHVSRLLGAGRIPTILCCGLAGLPWLARGGRALPVSVSACRTTGAQGNLEGGERGGWGGGGRRKEEEGPREGQAWK